MFFLKRSFKSLHSCSIRHISTDSKPFFSRKQELAQLKKVFSSPILKLNVVLGPPKTGKTTLINQVVKEGNFRPLFINCIKPFDTPNNIYYQISKQFKNEKAKDSSKEVTFKDVDALFEDISESLTKQTKRTIWNYYKPSLVPILVIDEAHILRDIGKNQQEIVDKAHVLRELKNQQELFEPFFSWLEKQQFHVVLITSDSYFLEHNTQINPYVIGDLSKEEAEEYFENQVLPYFECKELKGQFDDICKITGTRMSIISKYVDEYMIKSVKEGEKKLMDSGEFSIVQQEYKHLETGFREFQSEGWYKDQFIQIMKDFIKAEDKGFILESEFRGFTGYDVFTFIKSNFVHRRPAQNTLHSEALYTVMSQPSLCAMKLFLNKLSKNELNEQS